MLVGYVRVSTSEQNNALQRDALKAAGCKKIVVETASGTDTERPRLIALLATLRRDDTLLVWRFDRLARTLLQLLQTEEDLRQRGVGLRSLTEAVDLDTPHGRLIFQIQGAAGEYEWRQLHLRTNAGLTAARARGRIGGRRPVLSADKIKVAKAMLANTPAKVPEVARRLGVAPATLYRYLGDARA